VTELSASYPSGQDWEQVGELGLAFLDPSRMAAQVVSGLSDVDGVLVVTAGDVDEDAD